MWTCLQVTLFATHVAACVFYFLATRPNHKKATWLSLVTNASNQTMLDSYVTSLYWSIATLSSVGYGDLHAINSDEMIFTMVFVTFNFALTAYLLGNMTNLVVHWSDRTKRFVSIYLLTLCEVWSTTHLNILHQYYGFIAYLTYLLISILNVVYLWCLREKLLKLHRILLVGIGYLKVCKNRYILILKWSIKQM